MGMSNDLEPEIEITAVRAGRFDDSLGNTVEPWERERVQKLVNLLPWLTSRFTHAELAKLLRGSAAYLVLEAAEEFARWGELTRLMDERVAEVDAEIAAEGAAADS